VTAFAWAFAVTPLHGRCDPPATPAPPATTVSAEEELSPSYQDETGSSNLVNLRAQVPYDNANWVVRVKLPVVTSAPAESVTGAGDLALWDLAVIDARSSQWLIGPTIRIPTASDSLGSDKYSIGPSVSYDTKLGMGTAGFWFNSFFSVIGPSWYPLVARTQISPDFKFGLRNGWNVGLSTMQFTYDWARNRWTDAPLGFRIGKKAPGGLKNLDAYFEAERNFASAADTPFWVVRLSARWTLQK
jgi:hypothetical protein